MMRSNFCPLVVGLVGIWFIDHANLVAGDCRECKGAIPAAKGCAADCQQGCFDNFTDPEDIFECCQFDANCTSIMEDAGDCFDDCLDDCIIDTSVEYQVCIALNNGVGGCDADACDAIKAEKEAEGGLIDEEQLQGDLDEAGNLIDQTEEEIEELEEDIEELEGEVDENEDEIDDLEDEIEDLEDAQDEDDDDEDDDDEDDDDEDDDDEDDDDADDDKDDKDEDDKDEDNQPEPGDGPGGRPGRTRAVRRKLIKGAKGRKLDEDIEEAEEEIGELEDANEDLESNIDEKEDDIDDLEDELDAFFFSKCDNMQATFDRQCDIGVGCCPQCAEELEDVINCIVNDVMRPLIEDELDFDLDECEADCDVPDEEDRRGRFLRQMIRGKGRRSLEGHTNSTGGEEAEDPALAACKDKLTFSMSIGQMEGAMDEYLDCVQAASTAGLEAGDDEMVEGGSTDAGVVVVEGDSADPDFGVEETSSDP